MHCFKLSKMNLIKSMKKKANALDTITGLFISVAIIAIVIVVAFLIMANAQDQIVDVQGINESDPTNYTTAYNASKDMQVALSGVPSWIPLVIITVIGGALISLVGYFKSRR